MMVQGQSQSSSNFAFLNLSGTAKLSGLGGVNNSLYQNDINLVLVNPALLDSSQHMMASVNYGLLPVGVGLSGVTYAQSFEKLGTFAAGLQYLSYGKISSYDDRGIYIGEVKSSDFAVSISHARQANNFRLGATIKFVGSQLAGYHSNAILFDAGALFVHPKIQWTVGLSMLNFGFTTSSFSETSDSSLPFDIRLGTSIKPEHMPIRFSVTFRELQQWNLLQPEEEASGENNVLDNVFRHIVFGAEVLLSKNVNILLGYNHLRRQELKLAKAPGFSGFSVGGLIKIKTFEFVYAYAGVHPSGNVHNFTLTGNLGAMTFKK
jgi:hypothetical protein